jgi:hypothetical protein
MRKREREREREKVDRGMRENRKVVGKERG